jgi:hypothetical protein
METNQDDPFTIIYELQCENLQLASELAQAEAEIQSLKASRDDLKAEIARILLNAKPTTRNPEVINKWRFYHENKHVFKKYNLSWSDIKKKTDEMYDASKLASEKHVGSSD